MGVRQIAKLAGVSPSAVSLALHGSRKISESTKRRVRQIAERTGYRPNAKLSELMELVRATRAGGPTDCFGVISLYDNPRPWENSEHLKRIHASMTQRAFEVGYRLESLWLRAPGMKHGRFRSVLDARGIQGLLCFGSPVPNDHLPAELDHYAVVTVGLSIESPMHRVTSHFYNDTIHVLEKIYKFGYRRPGLVISLHEEVRSAYTHSSAYHGWCVRTLPGGEPVPVLRQDKFAENELVSWITQYAPDVIVFVNHHDAVEDLAKLMRMNPIFKTRHLGVAAVSQYLEGTHFSGMQQNQRLIGAWAVELLLSRIVHGDFGNPTEPRIEMVESHWVDGKTLRRRPHAAG